MMSFSQISRSLLFLAFGLTISFASVAGSAQSSFANGLSKEAPEYRELFGMLGLSENRDPETQPVFAAMLVSFSMPSASLERLARDAKDAGIPLVFRGVPQNEKSDSAGSHTDDGNAVIRKLITPEALKAFEPLVALGASVELNPELFSDHGITEVPALLLKTNPPKTPEANCGTAASALVIRGDATLGYLLDQVTDRADPFGAKAAELRSRLGARQ